MPKSDQLSGDRSNNWREGRPSLDDPATYHVWMWNSLKVLSRVEVQKVSAMSNVSKRPTFDEHNVPVESHDSYMWTENQLRIVTKRKLRFVTRKITWVFWIMVFS